MTSSWGASWRGSGGTKGPSGDNFQLGSEEPRTRAGGVILLTTAQLVQVWHAQSSQLLELGSGDRGRLGVAY